MLETPIKKNIKIRNYFGLSGVSKSFGRCCFSHYTEVLIHNETFACVMENTSMFSLISLVTDEW